jgi:hypothetical protein
MKIKVQDISVVIQGAVSHPNQSIPGSTAYCIESVRKHLPGAEIILSTWSGQPVEDLKVDHVVFSEDPGGVPYLDGSRINNTNRQIVSSQEGIKKASRPYALKLRADAHIESARFLHYFHQFPVRSCSWKVFKARVLTGMVYSRNNVFPIAALFNFSDWWQFGLTEDVHYVWDRPLVPEPEYTHWFVHRPHPDRTKHPEWDFRYFAEQLVWLGCFNKFQTIPFEWHADYSPTLHTLSELCLANNLVLLHDWQSGVRLEKYRHFVHHAPSFKEFYTFRQWHQLYRKYCDKQAPLPAVDIGRELLFEGNLYLRGKLRRLRSLLSV